MINEEAPASDTAVLDNRYVLGELLGSGGMARVFRARDTVLGREVAVKVFHRDAALPDGDVRRGGEVLLLAGLSHPGLVAVFDAGRDTTNPRDPFAYLVMELVEGPTLSRVLEAAPLDQRRVASLGAQLADALSYVHGRGVVHRDIKPANVLISGDGEVAKLTDFGVARLVDSTRLTVEGSTVGTANYLSPEQVTGGTVTGAADVYSLGLVLIECLTGSLCYPGHGVEAAVARLHRAPEIPSTLDPSWRSLLTAMTDRDPAARPQVGRVAARLHVLAGGEPDNGPLTTVIPVRRDRHGARWLVGALAAVVAGAGALVWSGGGGDTAGPAPAAADTATHYPLVGGRLGAHLRALEAMAPPQLYDDVLAVTRAAAAGRYGSAAAVLRNLRADLAMLHSRSAVSDALDSRVSAVAALVAADLRGLERAASPAKPSPAATRPRVVTAVSPVRRTPTGTSAAVTTVRARNPVPAAIAPATAAPHRSGAAAKPAAHRHGHGGRHPEHGPGPKKGKPGHKR